MIDTSAMVTILFAEPEAVSLRLAIARDPVRKMSAVTYLELSMVVEARKGIAAVGELEVLIADLHIDIHPFDSAQARRAVLAWRHFGKGRHSAGLNLGDVCTFAAASDQEEPILFKGDDFSKTDCPKVLVEPVLEAAIE
jgi:ribonuclease VapC